MIADIGETQRWKFANIWTFQLAYSEPVRQIQYHIFIQQQYKYKYKHIIQDIGQVLKFWSSYFSFYCKLRILRNIIEHLSLLQILWFPFIWSFLLRGTDVNFHPVGKSETSDCGKQLGYLVSLQHRCGIERGLLQGYWQGLCFGQGVNSLLWPWQCWSPCKYNYNQFLCCFISIGCWTKKLKTPHSLNWDCRTLLKFCLRCLMPDCCLAMHLLC